MPENAFEIFVALCAGIGLAAATGIRAFLPLLAVSLGAKFGLVDLNPGLEFLSSNTALVALMVATIVEIGADKIPIVDNMLDVVSTVLRPIAGFVAALAMFGELPQSMAIAAALVMSALSLGTQLGRAKARLGSTAATGGLANPLLSTAEDALSGTLSVLAIILPVLAGLLVLFLCWLLWKLVRSFRKLTVRTFGNAQPPGARATDGFVLEDVSEGGPFGPADSDPFDRPVRRSGSRGDRRHPDPMEIQPEP